MPEQNWIPEILYEENEDGSNSNIPFIMVPKNEVMPRLLYVFESRETEQLEPGLDGEPVPVFEWDLHQYADMLALKTNLDAGTYDRVRSSLGLEPLGIATAKGKMIGNKVKNNLNQ